MAGPARGRRAPAPAADSDRVLRRHGGAPGRQGTHQGRVQPGRVRTPRQNQEDQRTALEKLIRGFQRYRPSGSQGIQ